MENNKRDIYTELLAPFPIDSYTIDKSRGFPLTSLTAQYIKERLNTVFGVFGWMFRETFVREKDNEGKDIGIICHGKLVVRNPVRDEKGEYEYREIEATGGSEFKEKGQNLSDPYKSAATEALSKAASYIGIGNEMYKGCIETDYIALERGNFEAAKNAIKASKTKDQLDKVVLQIQQRKFDEQEIKELKELIAQKEK